MLYNGITNYFYFTGVFIMNRVKLAAHRGYSAKFPENTLLAMREAMKLDIDMLEIDLHMTADGEIILMHDHLVDRTSDGTGLIREKTLEEMRSLDVGSWKSPEFAGERVPTFREFLEFLRDYPSVEVNVELKDYPGHSGAFAYESCDKSLAMIEEYGIADRIYINAWSGTLLNYISEKYNGRYRLHGYYPLFLNKLPKNVDGDEHLDESFFKRMFCVCLFAREEDAEGNVIKLPDPVMPEEDFKYVSSLGVEPWVYFNPDTERDLTLAVKYGAVGVTSNDPVLSGAILDKIGARSLR